MSTSPPKGKASQASQIQGKPKQSLFAPPRTRACEHVCATVPTNVPEPTAVQAKLHPRKDVFVLKIAKVGPKGDRRSKMELELVTPKYQERRPPYRVDTRETQCDGQCDCCCLTTRKSKRWN